MLLDQEVTIGCVTSKKLSQHTKARHKNGKSFRPGQKDAIQNDRNEDAWRHKKSCRRYKRYHLLRSKLIRLGLHGAKKAGPPKLRSNLRQGRSRYLRFGISIHHTL